jgi:hypothetical protein
MASYVKPGQSNQLIEHLRPANLDHGSQSTARAGDLSCARITDAQVGKMAVVKSTDSDATRQKRKLLP